MKMISRLVLRLVQGNCVVVFQVMAFNEGTRSGGRPGQEELSLSLLSPAMVTLHRLHKQCYEHPQPAQNKLP